MYGPLKEQFNFVIIELKYFWDIRVPSYAWIITWFQKCIDLKKFFWVLLKYSWLIRLLVSAVQQSDSVIHLFFYYTFALWFIIAEMSSLWRRHFPFVSINRNWVYDFQNSSFALIAGQRTPTVGNPRISVWTNGSASHQLLGLSLPLWILAQS